MPVLGKNLALELPGPPKSTMAGAGAKTWHSSSLVNPLAESTHLLR